MVPDRGGKLLFHLALRNDLAVHLGIVAHDIRQLPLAHRQREFGVFKHLMERIAVGRDAGKAGRARQGKIGEFPDGQPLQIRTDMLEGASGQLVVAVVAVIMQHHREIIRADTRRKAAGSGVLAQDMRELLEDLVAVLVAVGIVDDVETVNVEHQDPAVGTHRTADAEGLLAVMHELVAVGDLGDLVKECEAFDGRILGLFNGNVDQGTADDGHAVLIGEVFVVMVGIPGILPGIVRADAQLKRSGLGGIALRGGIAHLIEIIVEDQAILRMEALAEFGEGDAVLADAEEFHGFIGDIIFIAVRFAQEDTDAGELHGECIAALGFGQLAEGIVEILLCLDKVGRFKADGEIQGCPAAVLQERGRPGNVAGIPVLVLDAAVIGMAAEDIGGIARGDAEEMEEIGQQHINVTGILAFRDAEQLVHGFIGVHGGQVI